MTKLLLAALVGTAASLAPNLADADNAGAPRQPHAPAACKPTGKVLFQIDHRTDAPRSSPTSRLVVDTNGAWTFREHAPGKPARSARGCLAAPELQLVEQSLANAAWKTSQADATCAGYSAQYTEYRAGKRLVLTRRMCDGVVLDAASAQSLARITSVLGTLGSPNALVP